MKKSKNNSEEFVTQEEANRIDESVDESTEDSEDKDSILTHEALLNMLEDLESEKLNVVENEEKYHTVFDNTGTAMATYSDDGILTLVNDEFEKLVEMPENKIVGKKKWLDFVDKEDLKRMKEYHKKRSKNAANLPKEYQVTLITKNGKRKRVQIKISLVPRTNLRVVSLIDITELNALIKQLEETRSIVNRSGSIIFLWQNKPGWPVEFVSKNISTLGYTQDDFLKRKKTFASIIHPEDLSRVRKETNAHVKRKEKHLNLEYRILDKNGKSIWVEEHSLLRAQNGKVIQFEGIITDITNRITAEKKILREKERAQSYLNLAKSIIIALNKSGDILLLNKKGYEVFGYKEGSLQGKNWFTNFISKGSQKEIRTIFKNITSGVARFEEYYENEILTKNGRRYIAWHNTPLKNSSGKIIGILSSGEDITDLNAAKEDALVYKRSFENSKSSMISVSYENKKPKIVAVNKGFQNIYGYKEKEVLGKNPSVLKSGKHSKKFYIDMWKSLLDPKKGFWSGEITNKKKNGEFIDFILTITTIFDEDKKAKHFVANHADISGRKKLERELKKNEEIFRTIFEQNPVLTGLLSVDGKLLKVNDRALSMIAKKEKDVLGQLFWKTPWWTHDPKLQAWLKKSVAQVAKGKFIKEEVIHIAVNGEERIIEFSFSPVKDEHGKVVFIISIGHNITVRAEVEEDIEELNKRYELLLHNALDIIFSLTPDGKLTYVTPNIKKLGGYKSEELLGKSFASLIHPMDKLNVLADFKKALKTNVSTESTFRIKKKTGAYIWVEERDQIVKKKGKIVAITGSMRVKSKDK